ncbi:hypothetical protein PHYSODRAFT_335721 [Phytophthora sojae]|uniref:Uncharacterized protein n=1 Tax=Phytophthora sojae (strain P6497) TaxID=1094619 RepID=G4ZSG3_PHYSP|nr:hypothetical protein PHYSODRAFT_335721 [Phytophthora sojae]EGZ14043.1 hypothetical protein PHYSODRAFT_335721 [Phytophthora sojae]|eukprot:XP_009531472.1 hypothetical protein PHYSODRAFT_335721 [Phytophthora sojae]
MARHLRQPAHRLAECEGTCPRSQPRSPRTRRAKTSGTGGGDPKSAEDDGLSKSTEHGLEIKGTKDGRNTKGATDGGDTKSVLDSGETKSAKGGEGIKCAEGKSEGEDGRQ